MDLLEIMSKSNTRWLNSHFLHLHLEAGTKRMSLLWESEALLFPSSLLTKLPASPACGLQTRKAPGKPLAKVFGDHIL